MTTKRVSASHFPAVQAIATLRQHSRSCRNLETREVLLAVERQLVQLVDLERMERDERWAAE